MKSHTGILEPEEQARQLEEIAHYDRLTGLPNRVLLGNRLDQAIAQSNRRGQPLAVVSIDLEGLRAINDRHGHHAGDQVLASLGLAMERVLRKGDTLARQGGDEFAAVLLDMADAESCVPILTSLLEAVAEPVQFGNFSLQVAASIGIAFYPQADEVGAEQLLRQAVQAMHKARQAGKNRYHFFDSTQDSAVRSPQENLERIRQALDAEEFVLYYQPKVNMSSGKVVGAEALIRWQHPERGLLPPSAFLAVIEDHPLSVEVGEWVISTALTQMEQWLDQGLDIPISVNVGTRQLQQLDFVDRVVALLAEHPRLRPSSLELEILESSALKDVAQLSRLLTGCRAIGVSLALDNFGAGNSSLNDLKRLPTNVLKIDPSFVREILENPEELTILEGVLGLATAFRRQSIAEGVESVDQGLLLLQLGCELAQGYAIAHPMQAHEFPAWAETWRPDPRWAKALSVGLDDRPLLYASVEHRAWIVAIETFLKGESAIEPKLSRHQCRFGAWLDAEAQAGRTLHPDFQGVVAMHFKMHALASGILKLHSQGRTADGVARLAELQTLLDKLLEQLQSFRSEG